MTNQVLNILFSTLILCYSIRTIYFTFKQPSPSQYSSIDWKGYVGGIILSIISIICLFGFSDLFGIFIDVSEKLFELKSHESNIIFISIILLFFIALVLIYYRPDKVMKIYKIKSDVEDLAKIKLIVDSIMCYYAISFFLIYLITKLI